MPSGSALLVAGWHVGLTAVTLVVPYVGHGLRRTLSGLMIARYALFVVLLIVTNQWLWSPFGISVVKVT
jgi:hypothetical protein